MRETLHLCGLLLLGLLVARSWGTHEVPDYIDCDYDYYYYPEICDPSHPPSPTPPPPPPPSCMFEITPPNVTEVEVTQMALCHVHCIDQVRILK